MSTSKSDPQHPVDIVELDAEGHVASRGRRTASGHVIVLDDEDAVEACDPSRNAKRERSCGEEALSPRPVKWRRSVSDVQLANPPRMSLDAAAGGIVPAPGPAAPSNTSPAQTVRNRIPPFPSVSSSGAPLRGNSETIAAVEQPQRRAYARSPLTLGSPVPAFVPTNDTVVIDDDDDDDVVAVSFAGSGSRPSPRPPATAPRRGPDPSGLERATRSNWGGRPRTVFRSTGTDRPYAAPGSSSVRSRSVGTLSGGATSRGVSLGGPSLSGRPLAPGLLLQLFNSHMLSSSALDLAQLNFFRQALYDAARSNAMTSANGISRGSPGMSGSHSRRDSFGSFRTGVRHQSGRGLHFARDDGLSYEALSRLDDLVDTRHRGASQAKIQLLPVRRATSADTSLTCCICLCDVEAGEELRTLPCTHQYHVKCIDSWLKRNACCPVDKRRIET